MLCFHGSGWMSSCRLIIKQDRSSPFPTVYSGINRFMYGQVVTCPFRSPSTGSGFPLVSPAEISLQSLTRCWIYFFCYLMMLFSKNLISIARLNFFQLLKLFLACTDYLFHTLRTSHNCRYTGSLTSPQICLRQTSYSYAIMLYAGLLLKHF